MAWPRNFLACGVFLSKLIYKTYNGYVLSQFKKLEQDLRTKGEIKQKHAMHLMQPSLRPPCPIAPTTQPPTPSYCAPATLAYESCRRFALAPGYSRTSVPVALGHDQRGASLRVPVGR